MRLSVILFLLLLAALSMWPCSLTFEPLSKPSKTESVFIAGVESVFDDMRAPAAAIRLVDVQPVSLGPAGEPAEVRVVKLRANCGKTRMRASELANLYTVGSRVAVVAERRRAGLFRRMRLEVVVGGNSSIDPAEEPSARSVCRQAIAQLERGVSEDEAERLLRSLIPDSTGELDLGGLFQRYIADPDVRQSLFEECSSQWAQWEGGTRHCEPSH